jgi:hypothetical protein
LEKDLIKIEAKESQPQTKILPILAKAAKAQRRAEKNAKRIELQEQLDALGGGDGESDDEVAAGMAGAPLAPAPAPAPALAGGGSGGLKRLPRLRGLATSAKTDGGVTLQITMVKNSTTKAKQPMYTLCAVDAGGQHIRGTRIGTAAPAWCAVGKFARVNGSVKAPSKWSPAGFSCELPPKDVTVEEMQPPQPVRNAFATEPPLPALTTGTELGTLATNSSANGFERSVNGLVNMVLVISGVGTTYQGTTCERFKTLGWTSTGQEVWLTVWEPPVDIAELLCDGARVLGESLKIGCHDGEISLSGRADNFTPVDRARCPTPSVRAPMDDFQPRALTEAAVVRFYKHHNATKLDDPEFIKGVMKMSDDDIRSECMRRYRAAPEPAGNRMSM